MSYAIDMNTRSFLRSSWIDLARQKGSELKVRRAFPKWARTVSHLKLLTKAKKLWAYLRSGAVSKKEKLVIIAAMLYLISPIDVVPDVIPVIGWLDDLGVAGIAINYILSRVDRHESESGRSA